MSDADPLSMVTMPQPRPWKKRYLFGAALVLFLVVITGWYYYLATTAHRNLQAALAETDRIDPGWRLEDILARRERIPDGENAALVVLGAKKLVPPQWPFWDLNTSTRGEKYDEATRNALRDAFGELKPAELLNGTQAEALRSEVKVAAAALTEARKVAGLPRGQYAIAWNKNFISILLPHVQEAREVARLLDYDALLRAHDGDPEGALTSCHAILNTSRSIGDEMLLISQLVRIAIRAVAVRRIERVLAQGEPPPAALERLQRELAAEADVPLLMFALRGERAGMDGLMEMMQDGSMSVNQLRAGVAAGRQGLLSLEDLTLYLPGGGVKNNRAAMLRMMNKSVEAAKLPPEEMRARFASYKAEASKLPFLARLLAPAVEKVAEAQARTVADLRCASAALAAERYRREHGRWPAALADLVPRYLAEVPKDPFDGQPLRLTRFDRGVTVYSVFMNGKDDGGQVERPLGSGGWVDWGFRLWDVPHRRQPAKPLPKTEQPPPDDLILF